MFVTFVILTVAFRGCDTLTGNEMEHGDDGHEEEEKDDEDHQLYLALF